jgi:hypothetical protein
MLEIDLGAVTDRAVWGYGVDPPADINPHLAWCRACQPGPVGTATGGPSSWAESGYCSVAGRVLRLAVTVRPTRPARTAPRCELPAGWSLRPYDLRHAAVSTWLNAGVAPTQVAEWAGHSVDVLLRVYAKCISGKQDEAKRRILEATRRDDSGTGSGPGDSNG